MSEGGGTRHWDCRVSGRHDGLPRQQADKQNREQAAPVKFHNLVIVPRCSIHLAGKPLPHREKSVMHTPNLPDFPPSEADALHAEVGALREQVAALHGERRRAGRRARVLTAAVAVLGLIVWTSARPVATAQAQDGSPASLIAAVKNLTDRVAALEYKTAPFSRADTAPSVDEPKGGIEITLTGANLHIVNGMGQTDGLAQDPYDEGDNAFAVNGLGNLIIGYNERRAGNYADSRGGTSALYRVTEKDVRTGSHNLVIGVANNYAGVGGIIAGEYNAASANYASVTGGAGNVASGPYSAVTGGYFNTASADYASATGGGFNHVIGNYASVTCGANNLALGDFASVSGGQALKVADKWGWAAGGKYDPLFTLTQFGPGKYQSSP